MVTRSRILAVSACFLIALLFSLSPGAGAAPPLPADAAAQQANGTTPGKFYTEPSTLHSLGFAWRIVGDANRNGRVAVAYRKAGDKDWRTGMDLLRIKGEQVGVLMKKKQPDYKDLICGNLYAGSIMFLEPGTQYDVRLTLTDPDNGADAVDVKELRVSTKVEPRLFDGGRKLHVYPADHKGTHAEPNFADLTAAYAAAEAGDQVLLHAGTYSGTYTLDKKATREKPIAIRDAGDGPVIFQAPRENAETDGEKDEQWHSKTSAFEVDKAEYLWIEGLTFRNYNYPIYSGDKGATKGLTVRYCTFEDSGWAGLMIRSTACRDLYVADNVFRGTKGTWHRKGHLKFPYKGVWIGGQGVDVCYNRTQGHKDGISVYQNGSRPKADFDRRLSGIDFYNNDVGQSWDDSEADGGQHNIRFFRNRLVDEHVGLSAQPFYGGPCYFVRNVLYNITRGVPLKLNCEPAGVLIYNNTFFSNGGGGRTCWNTHVHNNLFVNEGGSNVRAGFFDSKVSTLDYNGYTPGGEVSYADLDPATGKSAKNVRTWERIAKKFGFEEHHIDVSLADFVNVPPPPGEAKTHTDLNFGDFRLKPTGKPVDAGMVIPNITDGFTGKAPDMGAIELGDEIPHYGPRPREKR